MVQFRPTAREIVVKIVYYGPPLSGKTTNLKLLYQGYPKDMRGELIVTPTGTDRTIYFDYLAITFHKLRGMDLRIQLYTVPGQVRFDSTRQVVLRGVDGVVFVADSQRQAMQGNRDSWANLKKNLALQGLFLDQLPHVLQYNKRDLEDIASVEELDQALNEFNAPFFEAVAVQGIGVEETLEGITKLVLRSLRERFNLGVEAQPTLRPVPPPPTAELVTRPVAVEPQPLPRDEFFPSQPLPPPEVTPPTIPVLPLEEQPARSAPMAVAPAPAREEPHPEAEVAEAFAAEPFAPATPAEAFAPVFPEVEQRPDVPAPGANGGEGATLALEPPAAPLLSAPFGDEFLEVRESPEPELFLADLGEAVFLQAAPEPGAEGSPMAPAGEASPVTTEPLGAGAEPQSVGEFGATTPTWEAGTPFRVDGAAASDLRPVATFAEAAGIADGAPGSGVAETAPAVGLTAMPTAEAPEDPFALGELPGAAGDDVFALVPKPPEEVTPQTVAIERVIPRAVARHGELRELEVEVPVPATWVGGRRVTLQLRLTLVPEEESHEP
ncbi:MAG: hypothetical protein ACP5NF_08260 [Thermoanaerobaculum sp.]